MTLDKFLDATADVPESALRSAMVLALAAEPARTPDAYPRFYGRVMEALGLSAADSSEPAARLLSRAAS